MSIKEYLLNIRKFENLKSNKTYSCFIAGIVYLIDFEIMHYSNK